MKMAGHSVQSAQKASQSSIANHDELLENGRTIQTQRFKMSATGLQEIAKSTRSRRRESDLITEHATHGDTLGSVMEVNELPSTSVHAVGHPVTGTDSQLLSRIGLQTLDPFNSMPVKSSQRTDLLLHHCKFQETPDEMQNLNMENSSLRLKSSNFSDLRRQSPS